MLGFVFVDVDKIAVRQEKFTGGCKIWTQKSGIGNKGYIPTRDMSKIPFAEKIPKVSATQESPRSGGEKTG